MKKIGRCLITALSISSSVGFSQTPDGHKVKSVKIDVPLSNADERKGTPCTGALCPIDESSVVLFSCHHSGVEIRYCDPNLMQVARETTGSFKQSDCDGRGVKLTYEEFLYWAYNGLMRAYGVRKCQPSDERWNDSDEEHEFWRSWEEMLSDDSTSQARRSAYQRGCSEFSKNTRQKIAEEYIESIILAEQRVTDKLFEVIAGICNEPLRIVRSGVQRDRLTFTILSQILENRELLDEMKVSTPRVHPLRQLILNLFGR